MRKIVYILLFLVLLFLIASLFTNVSGIFTSKSSLFSSIPSSNIGVVYINDAKEFHKSVQKSNFWPDLQNVEVANKLTSMLNNTSFFLDQDDEEIKSIPVCASLHLTSPKEYDYLLHVKASSFSLFSLSNVIDGLKTNNVLVDEHTFSGVTIYELKKEERILNIAQIGSNIIFSRHATLIEEAINQEVKDPAIISNWLLSSKYKNSNLALYVNLENLGLLNSIFSKNGSISWFNAVKNMGDNLFINLNWNEGKIAIDGNIDTKNATKYFDSAIGNTGSLQNSEIAKFIPTNSGFCIVQNKTDFSYVNPSVESIYQKHIAPWLEGTFVYALPELQQQNFSAYLAVTTNDPLRSNNLLTLLAKDSNASSEILTYRKYDIKQLNNNAVARVLLGENFAGDFNSSYFSIVDNTVLIGNTMRSLQNVIDQYINKQSIKDNVIFSEFEEHYAVGTNLFIQSKYLQQLLKSSASPEFENSINKYGNHFTAFSPSFINIQNDGDLTGSIYYNSKAADQSAIAWNVVLDAPVASKPYFIKKTNGVGGYILVQDKENAVYLLSSQGQKLWKNKLEAPILSDVHSIDFYQNKEQQFLFNTEEKIHIIRESGEYLDNYPIKLSAYATTGLLLIGNGSDQYFFLPCDNEKLYGYELNGKPMKGWNPLAGMGMVKQPLKYLRQNENRFILAVNEGGTVSFINPNSDLEFVAALESPIIGEIEIDEREGFKVVIATCKNGKTYTINQEASYWSKNYLPLDSTALFLTDNILGSEAKELIFAQGQKVSVFNSVEKMFDYTLECRPSQLFTNKRTNAKNSILGVYCDESKQIYLLENYEKIKEGFPIEAQTPFVIADLFGSGDEVLLAGGLQNNIFAYRLK